MTFVANARIGARYSSAVERLGASPADGLMLVRN